MDLEVEGRDGPTVIRVPLFEVQEVRYSDLGTFQREYSMVNWITPLLMFLIGPTVTEVRYAPRVYDGSARITPSFERETRIASAKTMWLSLLPLWCFGAPALAYTDEEELFEALTLLRDHGRGDLGGLSRS